jgi:uncharacterized membrane protein
VKRVFDLVIRWIHIVAGTIWIGLLYFFNLVNVPSMKVIDASARPAVVTTLLPRALAWFRHAAWVTVLVGFVLIYQRYWRFGHFIDTDSAKTIFAGMILGLIMLINVWGIIWPNQKKIIAATGKSEKPNPQWGKNALLASRTNFILSFPMLFFMGSSSHFPLDWARIIVYGGIAAVIAAVLVLRVQK